VHGAKVTANIFEMIRYNTQPAPLGSCHHSVKINRKCRYQNLIVNVPA
jgi:hypothetical protein